MGRNVAGGDRESGNSYGSKRTRGSVHLRAPSLPKSVSMKRIASTDAHVRSSRGALVARTTVGETGNLLHLRPKSSRTRFATTRTRGVATAKKRRSSIATTNTPRKPHVHSMGPTFSDYAAQDNTAHGHADRHGHPSGTSGPVVATNRESSSSKTNKPATTTSDASVDAITLSLLVESEESSRYRDRSGAPKGILPSVKGRSIGSSQSSVNLLKLYPPTSSVNRMSRMKIYDYSEQYSSPFHLNNARFSQTSYATAADIDNGSGPTSTSLTRSFMRDGSNTTRDLVIYPTSLVRISTAFDGKASRISLRPTSNQTHATHSTPHITQAHSPLLFPALSTDDRKRMHLPIRMRRQEAATKFPSI